MTTVRMGEHELSFDAGELTRLRESTALKDDPAALRERFQEDGYLFIREFHDPELVQDARMDVLSHMAEDGMLDPEAPVEEGIIHPEYFDESFDMTSSSWTAYPSLARLAEGEEIMEFFERFLGEESFTFDYKWGRAKPTGGFTGFHVDNIFMGRGTEELFTVWRPIGPCPLEMGPLLLCPKSHGNDTLRETYGQMDVDADVIEANFSKNPHDVIDTIGGPLATAAFEPGDALIFSPYMLHGSLSNQTDRFRISIDTRYQSLLEPVDGRWVGPDPVTHYRWPSDDETEMADLRTEWGLERPAPSA